MALWLIGLDLLRTEVAGRIAALDIYWTFESGLECCAEESPLDMDTRMFGVYVVEAVSPFPWVTPRHV